jgi:hypothetical protein
MLYGAKLAMNAERFAHDFLNRVFPSHINEDRAIIEQIMKDKVDHARARDPKINLKQHY